MYNKEDKMKDKKTVFGDGVLKTSARELAVFVDKSEFINILSRHSNKFRWRIIT